MTDVVPAVPGDELRAQSWEEFIGQTSIKSKLNVHIEAAIRGQRMLPHTLLAGPPGFGKTTLSKIIAGRLGDDFRSLNCNPKLTPKVFASFLQRWEGGVLLLDEIHRLPKMGQEDLLPLLEGGYFQYGHRVIPFPGLTIIGATTEPEKIIPPLYDRFKLKPVFDDYTDDEMGDIVAGMMVRVGVTLTVEDCVALGRATGGIPRNAGAFAVSARDLQEAGLPVTAGSILDLTGVDPDGLNKLHLNYLKTLEKLNGTAGLNRLVQQLRLHESVVQELERLLVHQDLITYGEAGRELTTQGFAKITERRPTTRATAG